MIETFPATRPFLPSSLRWRLADAVEEGPAPYGLPTVQIGIDGGGWWEASFGGMQAGNGWHHRAMRAMALRLRGGSLINVPFIERDPIGTPPPTVPFSDGASFSDGTGLVGTACSAVLEATVGLRDDSALIRITTGHQLLGGDMFSIDRGPDRGHEMHCTDRVEQVSPGLWAVTLGPQFSQDFAAGEIVHLSDPMCCMRLVDPEGGMWPTFERNWIGKGAAKFVEAIFSSAED